MANIILTLTSSEAYDRLASRLNLKTSDYKANLPKIANVLDGMASGNTDFTSGKLEVSTTAKALITFTGAAVNDETLVINGVTFTAKTSGAVAANGEFNLSVTVATQAANLVAAIQAQTSDAIASVLTATSALGVVTLSAIYPGEAVLGYTISESMTDTAVTAWALDANATNTTI